MAERLSKAAKGKLKHLRHELERFQGVVNYLMDVVIDDSTEDQIKMMQYAIGEDREFFLCVECGCPVTEIGDTCENCGWSRGE